MGEKSAKKVRGHADLEPGETVVDACYGLGKGVLSFTDRLDPQRAHHYSNEASAATHDPAGSAAAAIDRTGIICVTDRRVLFLPVKTAITKPKAVAAAWPLAAVVESGYDSPMLTVTFADGPTGGLHVPRPEKPNDFVAHVNRLAATHPGPGADQT